jgi:hypothetical protein
MITIEQFLKAVDYKINDGSEFQWACFGSNARYLDAQKNGADGPSASIVFDTKDQTVYQAMVYDYPAGRAYRLSGATEYLQDYLSEAKLRGVTDQAWDDVKYIDLETVEDFMEKCTAIFAGKSYDDRVIIPIDLPDDVMFALMKQAHELDITFNQHVEQILRVEIEKLAIKHGITD